MADMTPSDAGIDLLKGFEGLSLTAYQDVAGRWTIGYGHTGPEVARGQTITQAEALLLLTADLHATIAVVNRLVKVPLTQNQFDALVDFTYNVGIGAFAMSHLRGLLNGGRMTEAAAQFPLWCHAGGKPVAGLVARREAEAKLFTA